MKVPAPTTAAVEKEQLSSEVYVMYAARMFASETLSYTALSAPPVYCTEIMMFFFSVEVALGWQSNFDCFLLHPKNRRVSPNYVVMPKN